jgi:hypothetical protein
MQLKWVFAALILANLGLWMWATWYKEQPVLEYRTARSPLGAEKMRLLTETGVKLKTRKKTKSANSELTTFSGPVCLRIGPFSNVDLADKAHEKLTGLQIGFATRATESNKITIYQVYLSPFATRQAAEQKRQELSRLGFKDHAVIQEDEWQNAISLGLFSVEANAESRVRELAAKGVEAKLQQQDQIRLQHWLDIARPIQPEIANLLKYTDWGSKEIEILEMPCPANSNTSSLQIHEFVEATPA